MTDSSIPTVQQPRLLTLGRLELTRPDGDSGGYGSGKVLGLLAYLTAVPERRATRDQLSDLFWSREDRAKGRQALRQTVFMLRRLLGSEAVTGDDTHIVLQPGVVRTDRDDFLAAVARDDAELALQLHGAPFLDGVHLKGADSFEEWVAIERASLLRSCVRVGTLGMTQALGRGDAPAAERTARRLLAMQPDDVPVLTGLVEALILQGRGAEALVVADDAIARAEAADDTPAESLLRIVSRLRRAVVPRLPGTGDAVDLTGIGGALVGREVYLQRLFAAAEGARRRAPEHLHLVGPAGIGKSRLLDEYGLRLRQRGVAVCPVRFAEAARAVDFSGFAAVARVLSALPAALGIAQQHAATLVAAVPDLIEHFPGVARAAAQSAVAPPDQILRSRSDALRDLIAAVCESRLVVLLLDDWHVCDPVSQQLIAAVRPAAPTRCALVTAGRSPWPQPDHAIELFLGPLGAADIRAFLAHAATVPEQPWVDTLLPHLARVTRGVPLSITRQVRELQRRGLLVATDGVWSTPDQEVALTAVTDDGVWIAADLPDDARQVLHLLALWPVPLEEPRALRILGPAYAQRGPTALREVLSRLERDGLIVATEGRWAIAHGLIRDEVRAGHTTTQDRALVARVVQWCEEDGVPSWGALRKVASLCGQVEDPRLARRLAHAATGWAGRQALGYCTQTVVTAIATAAGRPAWTGGLSRALLPTARLGRGGLAAVAALVGVLLAAGGFYGWESRLRLVVDQDPLVEQSVLRSNGDKYDTYVFRTQPRIRVTDGFGRLRTDARGQVSVALRSSHPAAAILGRTSVDVVDGYARFSDLTIANLPDVELSDPPELVFTGLRARASSTIPKGLFYPEQADRLDLVRVTLNGADVDPSQPLRLVVGDSLRLGLTLDYTTTLPTANIPLGVAVTWGPRAESVTRIVSLPRPVADGRLSTTIPLAAPPDTGHYHIVVAFGYEDSVDHLMSGTNWTLGAPVWNDGNDVHDLPEDYLRALNNLGRIALVNHRGRTWSGRDESGRREAMDFDGARIIGRVLEVVAVRR